MQFLHMIQTADLTELAQKPSILICTGLDKFKQFMGKDLTRRDVISIDLTDLEDLPALVTHPGEMDHDIDA